MFTPDQVIAAQKRNVEAFLGLSQKAFESVEKVVALNLQTTKASFDETRDSVLSTKDPKAIFNAQGELLQPSIEKATTYSRDLFEIATQASSELNKAVEDHVAQARKQMLAFIDDAVKNAPTGSENVTSLLKSSLLAANEAFDGVQKMAKQASEAVEANVNAVAAKSGKAATAKAKRA